MESPELTEPIDLGFSVADATLPDLRLAGQRLEVRFQEWSEAEIILRCQDVVGLRWQEAERYIDDSDRFDGTRIVKNSGWLAEHVRQGALFGELPFVHLKLNFNAAGILEILCTTTAVEKDS